MPPAQANLIGDRLEAFIAKQLKRFTSNLETALQAGDVDAVHDLRVASRRLTEPLRTLGDMIGIRKPDRIIRAFRQTRRAFRSVRDYDVVHASLWDTAGPRPLDEADKSALEDILSQRRERALRRAMRKIEQINPMDAVERVYGALRQMKEVWDDTCSEVFCKQIREVVRVYDERLRQMDPRACEGTHLHDARLCVKRMRYTVELQRELESSNEDHLLARLAEMQELLGRWNDHLMAAACISALARRPDRLAASSPLAARWLEYAAARAQAAVDQRRLIVEHWPLLEQVLRTRESTVTVTARVEPLEPVGSGPA